MRLNLRIRLPGRVWKDGKFWLIQVPALDAMTQGRTKKEAFEMIKDLIEAMADVRGFLVEVFPGKNNCFEISAESETLLALLLRRRREMHGYSLADAAKILKQRSKTAIARYEQGKSVPTMKKLLRLLNQIDPENDLLLDFRPAR